MAEQCTEAGLRDQAKNAMSRIGARGRIGHEQKRGQHRRGAWHKGFINDLLSRPFYGKGAVKF